MQYTKPHLSYAQQAQKLLQRGLGGNPVDIEQKLASVSYYRLSAYWYPFRRIDPTTRERTDNLESGTTFELVWDHYRFDRNLRLLFVDAIERIEIALRTQLVYLYTQQYSPFHYADEPLHAARLKSLEEQASISNGTCDDQKCKYECVKHFFHKYGDSHTHLPFWMFAEIADFGFMSLFYKNTKSEMQKSLAHVWSITPMTLISWLQCLNSLRNTCAHHGRIWNNGWGLKPKFPHWNERGQHVWYYQYSPEKQRWLYNKQQVKPSFEQTKTSAFLFICRYLLKKIAPQSQWHKRVEALFHEFEHRGIDFSRMGLPEHWQKHPLWK